MIVVDFFAERHDGVKLYRTYSSDGMLIERDGVMYEEAIDPESTGRTYRETDQMIPVVEEVTEDNGTTDGEKETE